ncbi:MAG: 3'-5' exonuclease [Thaumarchaeota archaeon]|nr:3'-5' exonuclease [Nitrososphaerota archaeon]
MLALDFESTGLSPENDRIIEVGALLYTTGQKRVLESVSYLVQSDVPISARINEITKITQSAIDKFGYTSRDSIETLLDLMDRADAVIGQNVIQFDKRMLEAWAKRENRSIPNKLWIDTRTDLEIEGKHLQYMCADEGWLNLFPHSALADCQSVLKLVSTRDINKVVERAQSPTVVLLAHQKREDNQLAKERKFRWNPFYSVWWKAIKHMDLGAEIKAASFDVSLAPPEILLSKLWYD